MARSEYLDELKKAETQRAVKMEQEELATRAVLEKMRDHPNAHLHEISSEVQMLNRKIEPILRRVEQAQGTL